LYNPGVDNDDIQKQLDILKAELRSISHERTVHQVFSREIIDDANELHESHKQLPFHLRMQRTRIPTQNESVDRTPFRKLDLNSLHQPIIIPEYKPSEGIRDKSTPPMNKNYTALMVPSMRQGSVPLEVGNIQPTPERRSVPKSSEVISKRLRYRFLLQNIYSVVYNLSEHRPCLTTSNLDPNKCL